MKSLFLITALLTSTMIFAQPSKNVDANNTANTNDLQSIAGNALSGRQFTGQATFYNPKFDREGSVHLFDRWNNRGVVYAKNSDGFFRVDNINFNIQRSMFEEKRYDSIASFNFANIEKIKVNGRIFKSYYFEPIKRQKVFEVIYEGKDWAILKAYSIDILDANPNPMIGRLRDKIIQRAEYFIDTPEALQEFKFKKRNILKALGDKASIAEDYARKYQMSFGKEEDVKKILSYVQRQGSN